MAGSKIIESQRTFRMIIRTCGPYCKSAGGDDLRQCAGLGALDRRWYCFSYSQSLEVELSGLDIGSFKRCAQCVKEDK